MEVSVVSVFIVGFCGFLFGLFTGMFIYSQQIKDSDRYSVERDKHA